MNETNADRQPMTTLSVFEFPPEARVWAFVAMAAAGRRLSRVEGLGFRKMMGAGRGLGFSARPDFGRYALLGVWSRQEEADRFMSRSDFMNLYRRHATRITTWSLAPERSHGAWDGENPFGVTQPDAAQGGAAAEEPEETRRVAVLTRATVRLRHLPRFLRAVPPVSTDLGPAPGLLYSIGIGERPWIRQATFSVWESDEQMKRFAYGTAHHRDVIRRTREEGWYSEDLFARFRVIARTEWRRKTD